MEKTHAFIDIDAITEFLEEENENLSEEQIKQFAEYLEMDFYDWLKSNYQSFSNK